MARKWMEKPLLNFPPYNLLKQIFFKEELREIYEFVVVLSLEILQKLSIDKSQMQPSGLPTTNYLDISIKQYNR